MGGAAGVVELSACGGDGVVVWAAERSKGVELSVDLGDSLLAGAVGAVELKQLVAGVDAALASLGFEVGEPVRDLTAGMEFRLRWWLGGEVATGADRRLVGAVGGDDLVEDVDGVGGVVGVGDDVDVVAFPPRGSCRRRGRGRWWLRWRG